MVFNYACWTRHSIICETIIVVIIIKTTTTTIITKNTTTRAIIIIVIIMSVKQKISRRRCQGAGDDLSIYKTLLRN